MFIFICTYRYTLFVHKNTMKQLSHSYLPLSTQIRHFQSSYATLHGFLQTDTPLLEQLRHSSRLPKNRYAISVRSYATAPVLFWSIGPQRRVFNHRQMQGTKHKKMRPCTGCKNKEKQASCIYSPLCPIARHPLKPLVPSQHSIVLIGLRDATNRSPSRRETPVSRTASVIIPSLECLHVFAGDFHVNRAKKKKKNFM